MVDVRSGRLASTAVLALVGGLAVLCGCDGGHQSLAIRSMYVSDPARHKAMESVARALYEKSGGRVTMTVPQEPPDAEREEPRGFYIEHVTLSRLALSYPPLDAFEAPYMFRDTRHFYRTIDSPLGQRLLRESTAKTKTRILDVWQLGMRHVSLRDIPARTPAEFSRVKLRVPPGAMFVASAQALGAQPTTMSIEDVRTALQTGIIDGQENALATIRHRRFDEVCRYLVLTAHKVGTVVPVISDSLWQMISPRNRKLLREAFREGRNVNDRALAEDERRLIEQFRSDGMEILQPDTEPFRQRAVRIWRRYAGVWGDSLVPRIQRVADHAD